VDPEHVGDFALRGFRLQFLDAPGDALALLGPASSPRCATLPWALAKRCQPAPYL
jgi:hypothetical protein